MSREFNVFELQKAIGAKDGRKSVEILERMLDRGEDPLRNGRNADEVLCRTVETQ